LNTGFGTVTGLLHWYRSSDINIAR
jgi:hypothetical protein